MKALTMGTRALTEMSNQVKETYLSGLVKEGIITKEQQEKANNYCIVVAEKNFFGKLWNKIIFKEPNAFSIVVTKIIEL